MYNYFASLRLGFCELLNTFVHGLLYASEVHLDARQTRPFQHRMRWLFLKTSISIAPLDVSSELIRIQSCVVFFDRFVVIGEGCQLFRQLTRTVHAALAPRGGILIASTTEHPKGANTKKD